MYQRKITRKDWHFKLANNLCELADNIFVEDINFVSWPRGIVRKQSLDSGIGQFLNEIKPYICWKRDKYYGKVYKNYTSQECPKCDARTGKKTLKERGHNCQYCGYQEPRDIASAKVIEKRGKIAVGHTVTKNVWVAVLTGVRQLSLFDLVKGQGSKNPPLKRSAVWLWECQLTTKSTKSYNTSKMGRT